MSYKSLKDTQLRTTPTCFGSQRIHHQGVITCTLTEITCNVSQIFIMCVVGVGPNMPPNTDHHLYSKRKENFVNENEISLETKGLTLHIV
jgi:hypothetical protein